MSVSRKTAREGAGIAGTVSRAPGRAVRRYLPATRRLNLRSASRCAGVSVGLVLSSAPALVDVVPPGPAVPPAPVVVVAPGVFVVPPGVLVVGVLAPGTAAPGVVAAGVVAAPGAGVVGAAGVLAAGVVMVVVAGAEEELESPASLTSAAARTASASAAMTATVAIGPFQLGVAARRVRAAAPQLRHQSCSGLSGVLQSGHASPPATRCGTARCGSPTGTVAAAGKPE